MLQYRLPQKKEYTALISLWKASVKATHTFLTEQDFAQLELALPGYFAQVDLLIWFDDAAPNVWIGFSGSHQHHLEMLFLKPCFFRKGYGTQILQWLLKEKNIQTVDVNKQNPQAFQFYLAQGFLVTAESPLDGAGKPFPILHLAR